ncbi:hypothetical protein PMI02_05219 [Novosphingobium sp. AP12]|nr:hypothetical protein PMI02_05219 [Novosphingobium sp. AP12]
MKTGTGRKSGGRRLLLAQLIMAQLAVIASPSGGAVRADPGAILNTALAQAQQAFRRGDCASVLGNLSPIITGREFPSLPDRTRSSALFMASLCEAQTSRFDEALLHIRAATTLPAAPAEFWIARLRIEIYSANPADAVSTLEKLQRGIPGALSRLEVTWLHALNRRLKGMPSGAAARDRLLAFVSDPAFVAARYDPGFEYMFLDNARRLAISGDRAGAQAQVDRLSSHVALITASLDPALRFAVPPDYDMRAATRREIAHLERLSAERPSLLALVIAQAEAHRAINEPDKALALLLSAAPEGSLAPMFTDRAAKLNWWWDELASTYAHLGRYDDAVAALKSGMKVGEHGNFNVSQLLNLASLQLRLGKPQDALDTLAGQETALGAGSSPYGKMVYRRIHGCAAKRTGKADIAAQDFAYALAHRQDEPSNLVAIQLCMGDLDGAAASIIARLDNPEERGDALRDLSTYEDWPANIPPSPDLAADASLLARPDVRAAIERAGGIRIFNVLPRAL